MFSQLPILEDVLARTDDTEYFDPVVKNLVHDAIALFEDLTKVLHLELGNHPP